jgi:hypothetical protein
MAADEYDPNADPNLRDPNTGQPYGGQPYGSQDYAGQQGGEQPPYGNQPPYGGQAPYGNQPPYGGQPYQGQPYQQRPYRHGGYGRGPNRPEKADEKQNEKEQEKHQEKGAGLDEKYHHNPLGFVTWALIIIWLGVTLLLQNVDAFAESDSTWGVFLWGAGALIILEALIRAAVPRWRRGVTGSIIWGAVAVAAGFGLWFGNWEIVGPIVVIAIGVGILLARILPRR